MWLERKVLGLGQRLAFPSSFLIPQQEKHMFFPYRGEIVPRVSKSLGTAHRPLGRKLGSTGSHSWKPDQAELADTLQEGGMVQGCWIVVPRSLMFLGQGPRGMLRVLGWMSEQGVLFPFSYWAEGAKEQGFARGRRPAVWV